MSLGQTSTNKLLMQPVLEEVVAQYPGTEEAGRATEMLDIIKNGYSKNIEADFSNKSIYEYSDKGHYVIIYLDPKTSSNGPKTSVVNFTREFFSRQQLKVSSKIYDLDADISTIVVQEFATDLEALEYIRVFKNTRKHIGNLQSAKILAISQKNLQTLFSTRKLTEYESFYEEYY